MEKLWTTRQLAKKFDSSAKEIRLFLKAHYPDYFYDGRYQLPSSELSAAYRAFRRWREEYTSGQRKLAVLQAQVQERIANRKNTARQVAETFDTTPEKLRVVLREMYPDHQGQWRFTDEEVGQIRAELEKRNNGRRPSSSGTTKREPSKERLHVATKMSKEDRIRAELAGEVEIDDDPYIRVWEKMNRLLGSQLPPSPPQVKRRVIGQ